MQQADGAHSATGTLASPGNIEKISDPIPSRRSMLAGMLGAMGATMLAGTTMVPASVEGTTPFRMAVAANIAAEARFNALPDDIEIRQPHVQAAEEDLLSTAWRNVVRSVPADWRELTELMEILTSKGMFGIDEDDAQHLIHCANRLLAGEA